MIKSIFNINGQDFSRIVTDISYSKEVSYRKVVETIDGKEHGFGRRIRPVIQFRIMISREHMPADYEALTKVPLIVEYDDPDAGYRKAEFRLDDDLSKVFAVWNCVDQANWFHSEAITLRSVEVI